jgi:hypothetical protein
MRWESGIGTQAEMSTDLTPLVSPVTSSGEAAPETVAPPGEAVTARRRADRGKVRFKGSDEEISSAQTLEVNDGRSVRVDRCEADGDLPVAAAALHRGRGVRHGS